MPGIDREYLKEEAAQLGFVLDDAVLSSFNLYAEQLLEWNQKINLTAITEPKEIVIKHFLDSLLLLKAVNPKEGVALIDIGAGAGFPSLPCKLYRPDLKLLMLDSLNKRINFLNELIIELGVHADCLHGRAEELANKKEYREQFEIATARAVTRLRELCEYCLPFVKVGGRFAALKGGSPEEEINEAKAAIKLFGGEIAEVLEYVLPDESKRTIVIIKKISQTPTHYPRTAGKMKKNPL